MTDRAKFEQMLEYLINDEKSKAEELFHDLVVAKSREIYENLLDDDVQVDEADEEEDDEEVEETFDQGIEEVGGDPADDMMSDMESDDEGGEDDMDMGGDEEGGDEPATKDDVMDIKDALEDLKAEFEAMLGGEEGGDDMDMGDEEGGEMDMGDEEEMKDDFQFEADDEEDDEEEVEEDMVREYVEKVGGDQYPTFGKMGDNGANTKSPVAGKNDMGGTTANIAKGGDGGKGGTQGGLSNPATKDLASGNVNVPGSKTATKMNSVAKGHGAEKKGAGEQAPNKTSIIGSK